MIDPEIIERVEEGLSLDRIDKRDIQSLLSAAKKCAEMQEWLEIEGQHTFNCAVHTRHAVTGLEPWPDCTCGLSKLLEEK